MGLRDKLGHSFNKVKSSFNTKRRSVGLISSSKDSGGSSARKRVMDRTKESKLLGYYMTDPMLNTGINKLTNFISPQFFEFEAKDEVISSRVNKLMDEFGFEEKLDNIIRSLLIYGDSYVVIERDENNRVVDLHLLNPVDVSFKCKSVTTDILLNENDRAKIIKRDTLDKEEFEQPNDIIHFTINKVPGGVRGIGVVEPLTKTLLIKLNIEDGLAELVQNSAFPVYHASVGSENQLPQKDEISKVKEKIESAGFKAIATDFLVDLKTLEPNAGDVGDQLDKLIQEEITGMDIPAIYLPGVSGASYSSTPEKQEKEFKSRINRLRKSIQSDLDRLLRQILESRGISGEPPELKWGDVMVEPLTNKMQRMAQITYAGLLTPSPETEAEIRDLEELPDLDIEWQKPGTSGKKQNSKMYQDKEFGGESNE